MKARAYKTLPKVVADYPTARYLFLTLTVKNCAITDPSADTQMDESVIFQNDKAQRLAGFGLSPNNRSDAGKRR
uniref:OrfB n=2 Tax=Leptolyngbya sp. PCC 6402 TaxID=272136 RepID=Q60201_9CYAN|nr:OrfB [Leptolyngbya sp. PCC 6402]